METIGREENAEKLACSLAGRMGHLMEPCLAPLGFDWRIGTALVGAFAAKEVFVAQMGIVYSVGEADETSATLREKLRANYTPLAAFCIMLFCLISTPCMATTAVVRKESGSWGWAIGQWVGLTLMAYFLTLFVYQIGKFTGFGH
jgi:ferrous iron transport protein B